MSLKATFDHTQFYELANAILNGITIQCGAEQFIVREVEFYYCNTAHPDQYTHCSEEQQQHCKFYFHKHKNGSYKGGTYKGLDITMSHDGIVYLGCLIRSIENINTHEFIEGPCKSVDTFLHLHHCNDVNDFVKTKSLPLDIFEQKNGLYVVHNDVRRDDIYFGPRIGLSNKYPEFKDKLYRCATNINKIKKQRKTFVKQNGKII